MPTPVIFIDPNSYTAPSYREGEGDDSPPNVPETKQVKRTCFGRRKKKGETFLIEASIKKRGKYSYLWIRAPLIEGIAKTIADRDASGNPMIDLRESNKFCKPSGNTIRLYKSALVKPWGSYNEWPDMLLLSPGIGRGCSFRIMCPVTLKYGKELLEALHQYARTLYSTHMRMQGESEIIYTTTAHTKGISS